MSDPVVIASAKRTPIGNYLGELSSLPAPELGSLVIRAAMDEAGAPDDGIDEVSMGCVLQAGLGMAPARQAALAAGVSHSTPSTTVNKVCGSGMMSIINVVDAIRAGRIERAVAGGMESMSNAPGLVKRNKDGEFIRRHDQTMDHLFHDGLEDAWRDRGKPMGGFAEDCAETYQITRKDQDDFARESLSRACIAEIDGSFEAEMVPVPVNGHVMTSDERPRKVNADKLEKLKPIFREGGTVTAGNSSAISDGAAALFVTTEDDAEARGQKPRGRIIGSAIHAEEPAAFSIAPVGAMRKLINQIGWTINDVDLFEINEAFAVTTLAVMRELGLSHDRVNLLGGACALGHPIGASGARIIVTLLTAMETIGARRGIATACIGGGEATAIAVEKGA